MDYQRFEKSDNDNEGYDAFVEWLKRDTAEALKTARAVPDAVRDVIKEYLRRGYRAGLSSGELIDYFCADAINALELADFSEREGDEAMSMYDAMNSAMRTAYSPRV